MDDHLYSIHGPKSWTELTSRELAHLLETTQVATVIAGAIEQHGPHLPLGIDNFQTYELVRRAVVRLNDAGCPVIFGPLIPFGPIEDLQFPGSLSVRPSTLVLLIREICLNLHRDGVRKIALVLGHDMSLGSMMVAARELTIDTEGELEVMVLNIMPALLRALDGAIPEKPEDLVEGLGGAGQTSRMLALHPNLVVTDSYVDYEKTADTSPLEFGASILEGGGLYTPRYVTNSDPTFAGHTGFPRLADAEAGERMYGEISGWIADAIGARFFQP